MQVWILLYGLTLCCFNRFEYIESILIRNNHCHAMSLPDGYTLAHLLFEGTQCAYLRGGSGPTLLLVHGSGPGASSLGNWRAVLPALARRFDVVAMDLVGFGQSGRKPAAPYFDFDMWVRQVRAMMSHLGEGPIGLVGHSLAGALALTVASGNPAVRGVVATGTMGIPFAPNDATRRTWKCPRSRPELVRVLQGLIHDHSVIDEAYLAVREPVIFAPGYADYFDAMFDAAPATYIAAATLSEQTLRGIRCPVTLLHGRDDAAFPPAASQRIAEQLADADLVLLAGCSHSVAFERPDVFLAMVHQRFGALPYFL
ncbi:alpha/beta hydrolase family protein [Bordetella bronchiseptica F4563]|nr:alpha/beta hydrolase family protein [Bordetella bronchiseptica CA90 BB02]KDC30251.1 alpha/beta hydrolase family protein [Bordetella bronchiseptica F4563]